MKIRAQEFKERTEFGNVSVQRVVRSCSEEEHGSGVINTHSGCEFLRAEFQSHCVQQGKGLQIIASYNSTSGKIVDALKCIPGEYLSLSK